MHIEGRTKYVGQKEMDAIESGNHPMSEILKPLVEKNKREAARYYKKALKSMKEPIYVGEGIMAQIKKL